ncbi:MAG: hypothetical protein EB003_09725 [Flavobacteriia bacterium]|nr:hypothetical protein [Flavobacteriia bacterium]
MPTKLFLLNKALNRIDLFYENNMPSRFFIGHSVGVVLAKATYSDYFAIYQNSIVSKNHGVAPILEEGVLLYPNTAVICRCHIRAKTVVSQGVSIINQDTLGNSTVFGAESGKLTFKEVSRNAIEDIFHI